MIPNFEAMPEEDWTKGCARIVPPFQRGDCAPEGKAKRRVWATEPPFVAAFRFDIGDDVQPPYTKIRRKTA